VLPPVCFCSFVICGCRSYEGTLSSLSSASTCPCLPLSFLLFVFPQYFPPFSVALLISFFFRLFWVSSSLSFPSFFQSLLFSRSSPFFFLLSSVSWVFFRQFPPSFFLFSSVFLSCSRPGSALFSSCDPPLRSLIFSGFIAREYQPFETASKPLLPETAPEEEGDEQLLKTVPFVRWE